MINILGVEKDNGVVQVDVGPFVQPAARFSMTGGALG